MLFLILGLLSSSAQQPLTQLSKTSSNITFPHASPNVSTPSQNVNPLPRLWAPQGQGQWLSIYSPPTHPSRALTLPLLYETGLVAGICQIAPGGLSPHHKKLNSTWLGQGLDHDSEVKVALILARALEPEGVTITQCCPPTIQMRNLRLREWGTLPKSC